MYYATARSVLVSLLVLLLGSSSTLAQDTTVAMEGTLPDSIVVTANRLEVDERQTGRRVSVWTAEDIEALPVSSFDELLRTEHQHVRGILENTEQVSENVRTFSEENEDSLRMVIDRLNRSLRKTESTLATIDRVGASLDTLTTNINRGEGTLGRLARDPSLYHRLDSAATGVNRLVRDFEENPERYLQHLKILELF